MFRVFAVQSFLTLGVEPRVFGGLGMFFLFSEYFPLLAVCSLDVCCVDLGYLLEV